jgi:hypothetical protein
MKRKFFLFSLTFLSIFLFTSIYVQSNNFSDDDKPNKKECPYLQNLSENKCPYLQSEIEFQYKSKELNSNSCPFLLDQNDGKKV